MNLTRLIATVSLQGIRVSPSLTRILPHEPVTHVSGPICYPCLRSVPPPLPPPPFPPHRERREKNKTCFQLFFFPSPGEGGRVGSGEGSGVRGPPASPAPAAQRIRGRSRGRSCRRPDGTTSPSSSRR